MVSAMLDDAMDGVVEAVGAALTLVATGFALPLVLVLETLEEEELVDLEGMVVWCCSVLCVSLISKQWSLLHQKKTRMDNILNRTVPIASWLYTLLAVLTL